VHAVVGEALGARLVGADAADAVEGALQRRERIATTSTSSRHELREPPREEATVACRRSGGCASEVRKSAPTFGVCPLDEWFHEKASVHFKVLEVLYRVQAGRPKKSFLFGPFFSIYI